MTKHQIKIAEIEGYIVPLINHIKIQNYIISLKIEEETKHSFTAHLKIKEKDKKQEKLLKFRVGIEQHDEKSTSLIHNPVSPHFEIDIYKREEQKAWKIYFNLAVKNENHLLECTKGTIVILKNILTDFGKRLSVPNLAERFFYTEAIEEELEPFKKKLIDALHESYKNKQLVLKINNKVQIIKTKYNFQKYLNIEEAQPIFLPLLKKIK